jgi:hypothetical protein
MSDLRKKPGWVFWTAVALILALAYPLSWGPANAILLADERADWKYESYHAIYGPLLWLEANGPSPVRRALGACINPWLD